MHDAIDAEKLHAFPERPESEFEWEDLLLRIEVMPRALRVEMENVDSARAKPTLAELTRRETTVQRLLEEVAVAESPHARRGLEPAGAAVQGSEMSDTIERRFDPIPGGDSGVIAEGEVDRFVRLRGRNFAMLQRRGIDVWNWRIRSAPAAGATVFQLLSLLARGDVEILARLREARTRAAGSC